MAPRRNAKGGLLRTVHAGGRGIVIKIEGDGESARKALEMVRENLRETATEGKRDASEIAEAMERVKYALESVGLYMGIREVFAQLRELTGGSLELGEAMVQASQKTGLTAETLSVLHYAAGVLGTDFDGLVNGVGRMDRIISQAAGGNEKAAAAMRTLGLNAKELEGRADGAEVAFHAFVDRIASAPNAMARNQIAFEVLGKAGTAQIPMLIQVAQNWDLLKEKAQAAGVVLSGETAEKLAAANQQLNDMKQRAMGAGLAFTEGLVPGLTQMMSVLTQGESGRNTFTMWGEGAAHILQRLASLFYDLAAAAQAGFAVAEGGKFTEAGRRDLEAYEKLLAKGRELETLSNAKTPEGVKPFLPGAGEGGGGVGLPGVPGKSTNPIAEAAARLAEEQAKLTADVRKAQDQIQLAELDAQHKMLLVRDQEFYAEKLRLQTDELDAEQASLTKRQKELEQLYDRQRGDGALKRNKSGQSAEELKTQTDLLRIQEQMTALAARRAQVTSSLGADASNSNVQAELAGLRLAAELEKERNVGITAQIALLQREADLKSREVTAKGGTDADAQAVHDAEQVAEQKLRIAEVTRQISEEENKYKLAVEDVKDAEEKGSLTKRQAAQQVNRLNQEELAALRELVQTYDVLAANLGGEYVQKAQELGEELNKLSRPDRSKDFGADLSKGMQSMVESIAESATEGKESFSKMAESILRDIDRIALKMVEKKFIEPLFENAFNGGGGLAGIFGRGGGGAGAAASAGSDVAGMMIPLAVPPAYKPTSRPFPGGGGAGGAGGIFSTIAQGAAKAAMPSMTHNIINQSSNPVTSDEPQLVYDEETRELIINTILHDHATGGPVSQLGGNG